MTSSASLTRSCTSCPAFLLLLLCPRTHKQLLRPHEPEALGVVSYDTRRRLFVTLKFSLCSAFLVFLSMTFTYLHGEALSCPE